jgi:subtilisin family serine protease
MRDQQHSLSWLAGLNSITPPEDDLGDARPSASGRAWTRPAARASATLAHEAADSPIAVVASGIDLANADLNASSGINCVKAGTAANDDNGHGTNVAGIIAARNNRRGPVGVARGTRLAVKALGRAPARCRRSSARATG